MAANCLVRWGVLAGAALFMLAACGPDADEPDARTGPHLEPRTTGAPRAAADGEDRFEYLRYAVNTDSPAPELCLTFSAALDPDVDYSAYVAVNEPVSLKAEGSRLCIGGLSFGQTRTLTLRTGLPSADGRALAADESTALTFDDRPAYAGFSGDGIILPRIDADGLALETVNIDELQVVVRRVTDRALAFRQLTSGYSAASGEWRWSGSREEPGETGVEVWRGRVDTSGPANARVVTVFPVAETIGQLQPGAYYVEIDDAAALDRDDREPHARARRWLIVTDLAFTAYRGQGGLDITLRSLQSARPVSGAEVRLIARSNEVLASVRTGADGRVRFDAPLMSGTDGNTPLMLAAYGPDGDFALLDLTRSPVDLSSQPVTGRDRPAGADGFVYTDRGVYRPGETVHASALIRDSAGRALAGRPGTLILYQPNGLEQARHRFDGAPDAGGLSHGFELPRAAARGQWRIALELDGLGETGGARIAVEDFVPQRVELRLEADTGTVMRAGDTRMIETRTRFLYGAPGAGLPLEGTARIQRDPSPFRQWSGFSFGRHDEQFAEEILDLPRTLTDGRGQAALPVALDGRGADSSLPLRVRAVIRVQEPGGRAVADDVRIPYRPREIYWGLRPQFDGAPARNSAASFSVIAVDAQGEARAQRAQWRLVRRDYQYDWYRTEGGQWRWRRSERIVPIETGEIRLDGEGAGEIATPPLDWGDYALIVSQGGEDTASAGFWVGWGGRTQEGAEAPDQVRVAGPQTPPPVGGEAVVTLRSPYAGLAEVVVATDRVLSVRQIEVSEAGAQITVPVTAEWGAGAYVMATVYTPRDPVAQPRPRRAVGAAYIPVDMSGRTFALTLDAPGTVEPRQTLNVGVQAEGGPAGERAFVTLAAVDEGILLLTNFQSPDPADWFFGKTSLGVRLHDDYGRLLDPNQGAAAPVRSGGDQIGAAGLSVVPTQTVALFSGPVRLDANGRADIALDLPAFNGELRLMGVVWSQSATGSVSRALTVRDPVAAELVLPRFLAPGDEAFATATLDNVDGPQGAYAVSLAAEGPFGVPDPSFSLDLAPGAREDAPVRVSAAATGAGAFVMSVEGPEGFAVERRYPIESRSPYLPASRLEQIMLRPGQSYTPPQDALAGFAPGSGFLQVSASPGPVDAAALFQSLYRYPYACTEQLISRAVPLTLAGGLAALAGDGAAEAAREVRAAVETILARQSADGAIGLWRIGDAAASPWIGAYGADFLSRAAEAGYPAPRAALERALSALQPVAQGELWRAYGYNTQPPNPRWSEDTGERIADRSAAYALYVLARNGQANRSRLRYMHDERIRRIESPLARAHIGAALAAMGDRPRAASAFAAAVEALGYVNEGDWYQTPRRDLAGVLALAAEAGQADIVETLSPRLARDMPEPDRLTTQEKTFLIMAARALAGDGEAVIAYDGEADDPAHVVFDGDSLREAGRFTNTGEHPVFLSIFAHGAPDGPPPPVSQSLQVEKRITDTAGRLAGLDRLSQGDRLVVAIELTPERRALASYVVADLLPAGFEIEAVLERRDGAPGGPYAFLGELSVPSIAEARDDRFVAAIDARGGQTQRFAYLVRVVTPGAFAMPGAAAEDMYRPDVFARSAPGQVVIRP